MFSFRSRKLLKLNYLSRKIQLSINGLNLRHLRTKETKSEYSNKWMRLNWLVCESPVMHYGRKCLFRVKFNFFEESYSY